MLGRARMLAAAAVAASVGLGCVGLTALPAGAAAKEDLTETRGVKLPGFYSAPVPTMPTANGALIRKEVLPLALNLPGINKAAPATATRLMYKSTDSNGKPVAVTGAYLEPDKKWVGPGPRPLVVLAPGTIGQGDQCSASYGLENPISFGGGGSASVGYEMIAMYRLLDKGVAVAVTDYMGMGTPNRLHTYVNRVDQGHAVLDVARVVRSLPENGLTAKSEVGLYGYSQGGGAVASAAELAADYAPEVPLKATYAGAPPADLSVVMKSIDGSELAGALGWSVNGFMQSDPALKPIIDKYTSPAGKKVLKDLTTMCVGDALLNFVNQKSSTWTTNKETVAEIAESEPVVKAFLAKQLIGRIKPTGVVRVVTGVNDNLVAHGQARTMAVSWCKLGGDVQYIPFKFDKTPSPLLNHFGPLLMDQGPAVDWLSAELAKPTTKSNCGTIESQP
jgi:dienelactone hydrolase